MFRISLLIMMSIAALCNASCDYPWVQIEPSSKCYLMSLEIMSWYEADMVCKENGGILAEPRTAEETIAQPFLSGGFILLDRFVGSCGRRNFPMGFRLLRAWLHWLVFNRTKWWWRLCIQAHNCVQLTVVWCKLWRRETCTLPKRSINIRQNSVFMSFWFSTLYLST